MSDRTFIYEPNPQMDAATAALIAGQKNNGCLFGSNGIEGLIGLIIAAGIFGGGNGNGLFGGGNNSNNNVEREMLMQAISRNGNDINSLAAQLNCSTGQVNAAINAIASQLCSMSGQVGMSSQQIINSIQAGNAALASQLCNCCCEIRQGISESNYLTERGFCNTNQVLAKGFSDIGYATRDQTCSIEKAIAASTAEILAGQRAAEFRELQNRIDALREKNSQQATAINNYQQTQTFAAMLAPIQADLAELKCNQVPVKKIACPETYVPLNRSINENYGLVPNCGFNAFGGWNGWNGGNCNNSLWG